MKLFKGKLRIIRFPVVLDNFSSFTSNRVLFADVGLGIFILLLLISACASVKKPQVVIYASVDQVYAEPILTEFAEQTGIQVLPVYDVEAAKTTGLVNRLLAERSNPQADVYWSGEFAQTILLKEENVLAPYNSPNAADIPARFKDSTGYWTGFGGRARVILFNLDGLQDRTPPDSIYSLLEEEYPPEKVGFAYPMFGTTATQAAALYAALGPEEALRYYEALVRRGISLVDGNSVVRDRVAEGQWIFGLTDTDDACVALQQEAPVGVIFPDQGEGALGTLVIPNTVALVAGGPHLAEGKQLVDYLLSLEVEARLVEMGWSSFPLRKVDVQPECFPGVEVKSMKVDLEQVYGFIERAKSELGEVFIR